MEARPSPGMACLIFLAWIPSCTLAAPPYAATLPEERSTDGVSYVSGGLGAKEAKLLRNAARDYSLSITMVARARRDGATFPADTKLRIRDDGGFLVVDTPAEGPLMLVNLPPGKYYVQLIINDQPQEKTVDIRPPAHRRLVFSW